jgi:hypothetical protein
MIDFIFTLDYEIFGNGTGALNELVYEPARQLKAVFDRHNARFVNYVEVAEFEKIEAYGTDAAIDSVKRQIKEFHRDGYEIALHLHPQWANAHYENGRWSLDLSEYNLCRLPRPRINEIVDRSLAYMRNVVDEPGYTPISFRAGNWLFQPTETAAGVLAEKGIRIDSSVFKGGLQHNHHLDYRPAKKNGYYWSFSGDVNHPDSRGPWIEVPIHTEMVPFWRMSTRKRRSFQNRLGAGDTNTKRKLGRVLDFVRPLYPLKLDFCRMTLDELTSMMDRVIGLDRKDAGSYRPVVAIGHTKDLIDTDTVDSFLSFLGRNRIRVATFLDVYPRLSASLGWVERDMEVPRVVGER